MVTGIVGSRFDIATADATLPDGVTPGDMIVVNGFQRVQPGVKVRATVEPRPSESPDPQGDALAAGQ